MTNQERFQLIAESAERAKTLAVQAVHNPRGTDLEAIAEDLQTALSQIAQMRGATVQKGRRR